MANLLYIVEESGKVIAINSLSPTIDGIYCVWSTGPFGFCRYIKTLGGGYCCFSGYGVSFYCRFCFLFTVYDIEGDDGVVRWSNKYHINLPNGIFMSDIL